MEKQKLLELTAPCSLLCYTCTAYKDGPVGECARKLYSYLDGFGEMRGQFLSEEGRKTWMAQFVEFCSTLQHIGGVCPGCRMEAGPGCIQGCPVPGCISEKGVDFCGECPEFPCQKAGDFFTAQNPRIAAAWEAGGSLKSALKLISKRKRAVPRKHWADLLKSARRRCTLKICRPLRHSCLEKRLEDWSSTMPAAFRWSICWGWHPSFPKRLSAGWLPAALRKKRRKM